MLTAVCFEPEGLLLDTRVARAAAGRALPPADAPGLDATDHELAALEAERAFDRALRAGLTLVPGARDALEALAAELRLAVVTRLRRAVAEQALGLAGLDAHVAVLVAAEDVRRPVPDPAGFRAAHARLARLVPGAADPHTIVALVDAAAGVDAARAAWLRAIFIGPRDAVVAPDARLATLAGLRAPALAALLELPPTPAGRST